MLLNPSIAIASQKDSFSTLKGFVLICKRTPFDLQKDYFYYPKGLLLPVKRAPFATQKDSFSRGLESLGEIGCYYIIGLPMRIIGMRPPPIGGRPYPGRRLLGPYCPPRRACLPPKILSR